MRIALLALTALVAGCAGPVPQPAPDAGDSMLPVPAPSSPLPVPLSSPPFDPDVPYCVVRDGRLDIIVLQIDVLRGDSVWRGTPLRQAFPIDSSYALNAGWYAGSEPIRVLDRLYVKYGLPRILAPVDVVPVAQYRGVTMFAEPTAYRPHPEVLYIPLRPGCEVQPYVGGGIK